MAKVHWQHSPQYPTTIPTLAHFPHVLLCQQQSSHHRQRKRNRGLSPNDSPKLCVDHVHPISHALLLEVVNFSPLFVQVQKCATVTILWAITVVLLLQCGPVFFSYFQNDRSWRRRKKTRKLSRAVGNGWVHPLASPCGLWNKTTNSIRRCTRGTCTWRVVSCKSSRSLWLFSAWYFGKLPGLVPQSLGGVRSVDEGQKSEDFE